MRRIHFVFAIFVTWIIINSYTAILYFVLVCVVLNYLFNFIDFHKQKPREFSGEVERAKDISVVRITNASEKFRLRTKEIPKHLQGYNGPIPVTVSAIKGVISGKLKRAQIIWPQEA